MSGRLFLVGRDSGFQESPFQRIKKVILDSVTNPNTKRSYTWALNNFLLWYQTNGTILNKATVHAYRCHLEGLGLAASTINVQLCAIRKLAIEACDNDLLDSHLAKGIARVKGIRQAGVRSGKWLTREQASLLLCCPDARTLKGKRDRAMLSILIGCGLRRAELRGLAWNAIQQREGAWVIPDLIGKGNRVRTVQVPAWVKVKVDFWIEAAALTDGNLFRAVNRGGRMWGEGIDDCIILRTVRQYGLKLGLGPLTPNDLRRTCANLCKECGGEIQQIQFMLGHASLQTTMEYVGMQNFRMGPNYDMRLDLDAPTDSKDGLLYHKVKK